MNAWTCSATFNVEPPDHRLSRLWKGAVTCSLPDGSMQQLYIVESQTFGDIPTKLAAQVEAYLREHSGKAPNAP